MKKARAIKQPVKVRGFFRVQITEDLPDGMVKIVGDSGYRANLITNEGFDDYLCRLLAHTTSSKYVSYVALGTGTAPGAAATTLDGELGASTKRKVVVVTISDSKTVQFTATFGSTDSFLAGQSTLRNIGLFDSSNAGTLFAGSTYPTSTCDSNQNVNVTYQISFS